MRDLPNPSMPTRWGVRPRPSIAGWRETVDLPTLGIFGAVAKLDSGAQTSAIHATDITFNGSEERPTVRFFALGRIDLECELELIGMRAIRSSNGVAERRPVVQTTIVVGPATWTTEFTLTDRSQLSCPVLVGRRTLATKFVVDVEESFTLG